MDESPRRNSVGFWYCTVPRDKVQPHIRKFPHCARFALRQPPSSRLSPSTPPTANNNHGPCCFVVLGCTYADLYALQAEVTDPQVAADLKKKRIFRTFSYRGVELDKLLDMSNEDVRSIFLPARIVIDILIAVR